MSNSGYLFDNEALEAEDRFGALASLFDPVSFRHFERLGVAEGWRCLEVGAGGGSVATWLATRVGESGHVLATDIDVRWLEDRLRAYAQGAPGVFTGDINYFIGDHDLRGQAHLIDTETCPVHMLTGEYDFRTVAAAKEAVEAIPGVTHTVMTGLGHFPMSEDPHRFAEYLLPVLDRIAELG